MTNDLIADDLLDAIDEAIESLDLLDAVEVVDLVASGLNARRAGLTHDTKAGG